MDIKDIMCKVDHTLLTQTATEADIKQVCDDALRYGTASVCIPPCYVKFAKEYLCGKVPVLPFSGTQAAPIVIFIFSAVLSPISKL